MATHKVAGVEAEEMGEGEEEKLRLSEHFHCIFRDFEHWNRMRIPMFFTFTAIIHAEK